MVEIAWIKNSFLGLAPARKACGPQPSRSSRVRATTWVARRKSFQRPAARRRAWRATPARCAARRRRARRGCRRSHKQAARRCTAACPRRGWVRRKPRWPCFCNGCPPAAWLPGKGLRALASSMRRMSTVMPPRERCAAAWVITRRMSASTCGRVFFGDHAAVELED